MDTDVKWAFNTGKGAEKFDLYKEEFPNSSFAGNYLSFKASTSSLAAGESTVFWGWYPPLPNPSNSEWERWPELKFELVDANNIQTTTINSKPKRTSATVAGKSYCFYAVWDGTNLGFTDNAHAPITGITVIDVPTAGTIATVLGLGQGTITAMKVTGNLNSADFKIMKGMANLRYLDLSEAICAGNKIPEGAFYRETHQDKTSQKLSTIFLPNTITSIGKDAFNQCYRLTSAITLPSSLETIGENAFYNCEGLTGSLIFPEGLTTIGAWAFYNCNGLTGPLNFPESILTIENHAFKDCSGFTGALKIPSAHNLVQENAFAGCYGFTTLVLPDNLVTIKEGAFVGCSFSGTLNLPTSLTTIEGSAFSRCNFTGLLELPAGLTTLGSQAFSGCMGFTGLLTLPNGLETIEPLAFFDCTGFNGALILPNWVKTIEDQAFEKCSGFTGAVIFPLTLTSIGANAFLECTDITAFQFPHTTVFPYYKSFGNYYMMLKEAVTIKVPSSLVEQYKVAGGWKSYHLNEIEAI